MKIAIDTLKSWSEIHKYDIRGRIYRGHSDKSWEIKTSIERFFERESITPNKRIHMEGELLREFKRAYHQYATHIPKHDSEIEWLSLMQHHGAPTRLTDFSYSIYVAAYFALETATKDCAVWMVDGPWALNESIRNLEKAGVCKARELNAPSSNESEPMAFRNLFADSTARCAPVWTPFRLNERLRIQKGTFAIASDLKFTFMQNLKALNGYEKKTNLLKLIIPLKMRRKALEHLYYMGITRTTLFPGLDGYAQSLGVYHNMLNPAKWNTKKPT
ncbi:MAG: FRG domain-containing protein [Burkholderiales bacterium]